jgi:hypothetical protein
MSKPRPDAPDGHFKNGGSFTERNPEVERDGMSHTAFAKARAPSPLAKRVRQCLVCHHPERIRIEALRANDVSLDVLSAQFGIGRDAIWRHCNNHVTEEAKIKYLMGKGQIATLAKQAAEEGRSVLDYLVITRSILMNQLAREAELNKSYAVERVAGRLIDTLKEIGSITGEVAKLSGTVFNIQNNVQILNSPPFLEMQTGLLELCAKHPGARADIIELCHAIERRYPDDQDGSTGTKLIEHRANGEVAP